MNTELKEIENNHLYEKTLSYCWKKIRFFVVIVVVVVMDNLADHDTLSAMLMHK